MNVAPLGFAAAPLPAAVPTQRAQVSSGQLLTASRLAWEHGGRLIALWGSDERDRRRGFCSGSPSRIATVSPCSNTRCRTPKRAIRTSRRSFPRRTACSGRRTISSASPRSRDDQRPWLWHGGWPIDQFPLRQDFVASPKWEPGQEEYDFVKVEGDGVHEIPVGPVHAGIIEPGHFRFQIVGEKVLRLEERLGYTHKGIEKRFESLPIDDAGRLAGRICGDSTVAYAWAYAQASSRSPPPPCRRAHVGLRALCSSASGIANHLGDLGALGNDGGFAFGLAQFSRLREDVLRANASAVRAPLLMDVVVPGGIGARPGYEHVHAMHDDADRIAREVVTLRDIYDEHAGLQDRFRNCGRVTPDLAAKLGLLGLAGRASGIARDLRCDFPAPPYDALPVRIAVADRATSAARVAVRFDEALESVRLIACITAALLDAETPAMSTSRRATSPRPARRRLRRGLARTGPGRARKRHGRQRFAAVTRRTRRGADWPVDRARRHRQHRSRLPADQQVVQPLL